MNAKQYRAALEKLGLSQLAAGELLKVGSRTSRRWALDEGRIPSTAAMLLQLLLKRKIKVEDLQKIE